MTRSILLMILLALALPAAAASYAPVGVDLPVKQVAPHTYYVLGAAGMATKTKALSPMAALW